MAKGRKGVPQKSAAIIELLALPLACVVEGTPATLQSSSTRKKEWKANVANAIRVARGPGVHCLPLNRWVRVQIHYYFLGPQKNLDIDIDNIIKPVMDAANRIVYQDDIQVIEVCSQRFSIEYDNNLSGDARILGAIKNGGEFVYIAFSSGD